MANESAQNGRSERRRHEILAAARTLFFEKGYRGTTIRQIAEAAGYSKRTVYLDYPSKDELFLTLCAEGGLALLGKLRAIPAVDLTVEDCIERFLDVFVSFSRDHSEYFRMIFSEATPEIIGGCTPALRERVGQLERACLGVVVAWAERAVRDQRIRAVDPWETAGILVGTATGIVLLSLGGSQTVFSKETLEDLTRSAVRTYWRGLSLGGEP